MNDKPVKFSLQQTFPILSDSGKLISYDTSFCNISFYKNMKSYEFEYQYTKWNNQVKEFTEGRSHFVIHRIGSTDAIDFDDSTTWKQKKINLRDLYKTKWIFANDLYAGFRNYIPVLTSSKWLNDSTLFEVYNFQNKADTALIVGSCELFYTKKWKDIDVTLSRSLDSLKGMKLIKAKMKTAPQIFQNMQIDGFESDFSLSKLEDTTGNHRLMQYFTKFESQN